MLQKWCVSRAHNSAQDAESILQTVTLYDDRMFHCNVSNAGVFYRGHNSTQAQKVFCKQPHYDHQMFHCNPSNAGVFYRGDNSADCETKLSGVSTLFWQSAV